MSDVEFIPLVDSATGREPDGRSLSQVRPAGRRCPTAGSPQPRCAAELVRLAECFPEYDQAAGEALLWSMSDFLETRGSGRAQEYRA